MVMQTLHAVISVVEGLEIESKKVKYGVVMLSMDCYGMSSKLWLAGNWDFRGDYG